MVFLFFISNEIFPTIFYGISYLLQDSSSREKIDENGLNFMAKVFNKSFFVFFL